MKEKEQVTWYKEGNFAAIIINNPPVNALSSKVLREMTDCLKEIGEEQNINAVLITGAGEQAFIAGADLKEISEIIDDQGKLERYADLCVEALNRLDSFPKPTVALVNNLALGGGCEIVLACDIRIASDKTKIGLTEVKVGLIPGGGGTQRLPRLIGEAKAKQLLYLGEIVDAEEALSIGLVNYVVRHEQSVAFAKELCRKIAEKPGISLKYIKECVDKGTELRLEQGVLLESCYFKEVFKTEDAREGVNAFVNKRKPVFKNT